MKTDWQRFWIIQQQMRSILQTSKEQKPVIVIGNTRAGKSTLINSLMGVKMFINESGNLEPEPGQKVFARAGGGNKSVTVYPQIFPDGPHGLAICDCPGFLENRDSIAAAVALAVPIILQEVDVQGILVVADSALVGDLDGGRPLRQFAALLQRLIPLQELKGKIVFAWTKGKDTPGIFQEKFNESLNGTPLDDLIDDDNSFYLQAQDPDVDSVRAALARLAKLAPIPAGSLHLPQAPVPESSEFRDLAMRINGRRNIAEGVANPALAAALTSLQRSLNRTAMEFHKVSVHALQLPDLDVLQGTDIQRSLIEVFNYCTSLDFRVAEFPPGALVELLGFLRDLRHLFQEHFINHESQLRHFDFLIQQLDSVNHFTRYNDNAEAMTRLFTPAPAVTDSSPLIRLRHEQNYLSKKSIQDGRSSDLSGVLEDPVRMNSCIGQLIEEYSAQQAQSVVNPRSMIRTFHKMAVIEKNIISADAEPRDLVSSSALRLLTHTEEVINQLGRDAPFFARLMDAYYTALQRVVDTLAPYIAAYEQSIKSARDSAYAGGASGGVGDFRLLEQPNEAFLNQFSGRTLNKLPRVSSGYISPHYVAVDESGRDYPHHAVTDGVHRALNLSAGPFFEWARGRVSRELLCAEYLGILEFTQLVQTADVKHPNIPYMRESGHATAVMRTVRQDFHRGGDGVSGPHGAAFLDGDLSWVLPFDLESTLGRACSASFSGNYNDISVQAGFWRQSDSRYSDPGGDGGFHHRLRHALAPYVSGRWNSRAVNISAFNNLLNPRGLINDYFLQRRRDLARILTTFPSDAPRQDLLNAYQGALQALNTALYRLKVFAFLAGKDISAAPFNQMIGSQAISAEITNRAELLGEPNLIPNVQRVLSTRSINGWSITGAPGMRQLPFAHPLNLLKLGRKLLQAQNTWRALQFTEPGLEIPTPEIQRGYQRLVLFADGMELPKRVPADAIYLYKTNNELKPVAYWINGDKIEFKSLELHKRRNAELLKLFASVKESMEINRETRASLIDNLTEALELKLPIVHLPAYVRSLPADTQSIVIKHRSLGDESDCFELGVELMRHPHIKELTLSHVEMTREQLAILVNPIKALKLVQLNLSHNPCRDGDGPSLIQELLTSLPTLTELDLSHTNLGSKTLKSIANALVGNPALKIINLRGIESCDDNSGLSLLAALFVNTELAVFQINGASVRIIIADAINHIMAHKHTNPERIPQEREARIVYFDRVLNEFLATRAEEVEVLEGERNIFPYNLHEGRKVFSLGEFIRREFSPSITIDPPAPQTLPGTGTGVPTSPGTRGGGTTPPKPESPPAPAAEVDRFIVDLRSGRQNGWECFDIAVDLTRRQIVDFALAQRNNLEIRRLLAPEIFSAMISNQLPPDMQTEEANALIRNNGAIDEEVAACQGECNDVIPHPGRDARSMSDFGVFFADRSNQVRYPNQWALYNRINERIVGNRAALNNYCERADIYESYVQNYYGLERYFVFHRTHGSEQTSMVDIVARLLRKQIVIYQTENGQRVEIYRTRNAATETANVQYNGHNHFVALVPNPAYRPAPRAPTGGVNNFRLFTSVTSGRDTPSVASKDKMEKESKYEI